MTKYESYTNKCLRLYSKSPVMCAFLPLLQTCSFICPREMFTMNMELTHVRLTSTVHIVILTSTVHIVILTSKVHIVILTSTVHIVILTSTVHI
jgi:hypothetical protein